MPRRGTSSAIRPGRSHSPTRSRFRPCDKASSFRGARMRELWCALAHQRIWSSLCEIPDLVLTDHPGMTHQRASFLHSHFLTVLAGPLVGGGSAFFTGFRLSLSAAVFRSSISFVTRAALEPRS